jgi:acetaldehyde dehydrogenase
MVAAVSQVTPVAYAEIVATVASRSAGPGTRESIDSFTRTTAKGLEEIGGAQRGKAIIILNPADPPLMMRDTVFCSLGPEADRDAILESIDRMQQRVASYVPGYRLRGEPIFEDDRVAIFVEVEGAADYLPAYAGNLDIMTAAAVAVAEQLVNLEARSEVLA